MWLSLSPVEAVVWYWTQLGLLSAIELPESTCVGPSIKCSIQWLSYLRRGGKYVNKHTSWGQKSIAIRTNLYIYNCNLFKVIKKIHCFFSSSFSMQYHSHKIWIIWDEKKHLLNQLFCSRRTISCFDSFHFAWFCVTFFLLSLQDFYTALVFLPLASCLSDLERGIFATMRSKEKTSHFSASIDKLY